MQVGDIVEFTQDYRTGTHALASLVPAGHVTTITGLTDDNDAQVNVPSAENATRTRPAIVPLSVLRPVVGQPAA